MRRDVENWVHRRNDEKGPIDWQFTAKDARLKRKRRYPDCDIDYALVFRKVSIKD
jgi:hypothetical protein